MSGGHSKMKRQSRNCSLKKRLMLGAMAAQLAITAAIVPPPLPNAFAASAQGSSQKAKKPKKVKDKYEDNCEVLRKPFTSIKNEQFGRTVGGAVLGGVAGLLIGSQIKKKEVVYDRNGRAVGVKESNRALELGLAGAVAGGLAGYLTGIEQHRQNQEELRAALDRRDADRGQFSDLGQKLADLGNCRNQQIYDVRTQLDSGTITAEVADSRVTKIEKWIAKDDEIIEKASGMDAQSVTLYAQTVAVADGVSAADAEKQGDQMVARYSEGSERMVGDVSVNYDPAQTASSSSTPEVPETVDAFVKSRSGANVRAQPSAQAAVIGSLPYQAKIAVMDSPQDGWARIALDGKEGYVAESLLSRDKPRTPAAARPAPAPRPDLAPGRIVVRPKTKAAPATRQGAVTRAVAERDTLKAVDAARRTSNRQQLAETRNRVAAALQAARS
jgi:uncharacterized protein YgiM (DUF1202 family)